MAKKELTHKEISSKGGKATFEKYGREEMVRRGKLGAEKKKKNAQSQSNSIWFLLSHGSRYYRVCETFIK